MSAQHISKSYRCDLLPEPVTVRVGEIPGLKDGYHVGRSTGPYISLNRKDITPDMVEEAVGFFSAIVAHADNLSKDKWRFLGLWLRDCIELTAGEYDRWQGGLDTDLHRIQDKMRQN